MEFIITVAFAMYVVSWIMDKPEPTVHLDQGEVNHIPMEDDPLI